MRIAAAELVRRARIDAVVEHDDDLVGRDALPRQRLHRRAEVIGERSLPILARGDGLHHDGDGVAHTKRPRAMASTKRSRRFSSSSFSTVRVRRLVVRRSSAEKRRMRAASERPRL